MNVAWVQDSGSSVGAGLGVKISDKICGFFGPWSGSIRQLKEDHVVICSAVDVSFGDGQDWLFV